MSYEYKRYMRDGSVEVRAGVRTAKQVRTGKTKAEKARKRPVAE